MTAPRCPLHAPDTVRALEAAACRAGGFVSFELMRRAGAAAFRHLRERWPAATRIAVVCGTGNNGGDGYVLAALAKGEGLDVTVLQVGSPAEQGDARQAWLALGIAGVRVTHDSSVLSEAELIVDALFGIGLNRVLEGETRAVISCINAQALPVLSLDIPSGLHALTGAVMGEAVRASSTVTFIAHKPGLHTGAARAHTGAIMLADLGVSGHDVSGQPAFAELVHWRNFSGLRRPRSPVAHKGDAGHVLVIGGGEGMGGAARLAAEAALRAGAGLVSAAIAASAMPAVMAGRPEIMAHAVASASELRPLLQRASVIAVGPGLGQTAWARGLWAVVRDAGLPLVVDADALNLLAADPEPGPDWILTPHPGEAARLLATSTAAIAQDRYTSASQLQTRYGGAVVLKGAGTIVCSAAGTTVVAGGNPGMASGGMGDVLTGVIAALLAQGLAPPTAAVAGAALHAAAGDEAARAGARGMLASDLMPCLRQLVN
ncbi:MAG: hypothetical protein RL434_857 [Pseudomonadota bacterium]